MQCSRRESLLLCAEQGSSNLVCGPLPHLIRLPRAAKRVSNVSELAKLWTELLQSRYKSFKITFMHIFCALTMTAGYTLREVGAFHYTTVNIYIASMTIIYSVP